MTGAMEHCTPVSGKQNQKGRLQFGRRLVGAPAEPLPFFSLEGRGDKRGCSPGLCGAEKAWAWLPGGKRGVALGDSVSVG